MAFNSDGFHLSIQNPLESTRFAVDKITDTFLGQDNKIYYKVKWQETWEPEERVMVLCAQLVNEFWKEYYTRTQREQQTARQTLQDVQQEQSCTTVTETTVPTKETFILHSKNDAVATDGNKQIEQPSVPTTVSEVTVQNDITKQAVTLQAVPLVHQHPITMVDGSILTNTLTGGSTTSDNLHQISAISNLTRFTGNLFTKRTTQMFLQPRMLGATSSHLLNPITFTPTFIQLSHHLSEEMTKQQQNTKNKMKTKTDYKYVCDVCAKEFENNSMLKKHVEAEHTESIILACETCGKTFDKKTALNRHQLTHSSTRPHVCEQCGKGFKEKSNLSKHMVIHTGVRPHACDICNARFRQLGHLWKHILVHKPDKPFKCDFCPKSFKRKEHLKDHLVIHSGCFPFQCEICEKKFRFKTNLRVHFGQHSGSKDFICEVCGKAFIGKANLAQHILIHKEVFDFECGICLKKFKRKGHLQRHMDVHKPEKLFNCIICKDDFTNKIDYRKHMLQHAGSKPFACISCNKRFSTKSQLITHKKNHNNKCKVRVSYKCGLCQDTFGNKTMLTKHITESHEAPWECSRCQKSFVLINVFVEHFSNCSDTKTKINLMKTDKVGAVDKVDDVGVGSITATIESSKSASFNLPTPIYTTSETLNLPATVVSSSV